MIRSRNRCVRGSLGLAKISCGVSGILTGNWLGGLVGAKSFLGVDHWATDPSGSVSSARLQRIGGRLSDLARGTGTMLAESTDGKLVAVLREDGSVAVYSTRGQLLRTVTPAKGQPRSPSAATTWPS
jgi:hypothetical protein